MTAPKLTDTCQTPPDARAQTIADAGLAPDTVAALNVLRHIFQTFTVPASQGWVRAFETAYAHFPQAVAADIGVAALALVRHLAAARSSGFVFCNPDCAHCAPRLAPDEYQLAGLIEAVRAGARAKARTHAMLLCEGRSSTGTLAAAHSLCDLLDAAHGLSQRAAPC